TGAAEPEAPRGIASRSTKSISFIDIDRWVFRCAVVDGAEPVEALLLGRQTGGRRRRRLLVERAVHPLVAPVLLRPAMIRSGRMPSLIHHTASRDSPPTPDEAKGGPLSERIASDKPCSLNAASKIGRTLSSSGR